jgi:hypothetical protein
MKGTTGAVLRRPLIIAVLVLTMFATTVSGAGASTVTTTTVASRSECGILTSPTITTTGCTITLRLGQSIRVKLAGGFRWGYPVSSSRDVVVSKVTRNSIGVDAMTLHAVVVGRATIHMTGTVYCKPGVACPDLALLGRITVIVKKAST